jgi:hypothetical protein
VIAVRMGGLLVWVVERVAKFPREHRFTIGERLVETSLGVCEALVDASYRRDRQGLHSAASAGWREPARSAPAGRARARQIVEALERD